MRISKISDLYYGRSVDVVGVITKVYEPRNARIRKTGEEVKIYEYNLNIMGTIHDVLLVVWGKDYGLKEGDKVEVKNAYVTSYGLWQLNVGKFGEVTKVS